MLFLPLLPLIANTKEGFNPETREKLTSSLLYRSTLDYFVDFFSFFLQTLVVPFERFYSSHPHASFYCVVLHKYLNIHRRRRLRRRCRC